MDSSGNGHGPNRIPIRFVDEDGTVPDEEKNESTVEASNRSNLIDAGSVGESLAKAFEEFDSQSDLGDQAEDPDSEGDARFEVVDPADHSNDDTPRRVEQSPVYEAHSRKEPPLQPVDPAAGPAVAELIATRAELRRVEAELIELRDTLARRQADFENFRKRVERERSEAYNRVVGEVAGKLLPVVDNLRRALDAEASLQSGESEEFAHFLNGVELISRQLADVLSGLGVEPIESVGKTFDPHLHEAVATEVNEEVEADTVLQELARGYVIGDKLLRPAIVKVSTR